MRSTPLAAVSILLLPLLLLMPAQGSAIHVSPAGNDGHDGGAPKPVASLKRAAELAASTGAEMIVLHSGVYRGLMEVGGAKAQLPPLLITAAPATGGGFENAVLDGSIPVADATPLPGHSGVSEWRTSGFQSNIYRPEMWERDTRRRYTYAADSRGVIARPASFYHDEPNQRVLLHTSDGLPPHRHEIGAQHTGIATRLWLRRNRVTLRGLTFRNGADISVDADDITIEDCRSSNVGRAAITIQAGADRARILRHHADDVAAGIISNGNDAIVQDSQFHRPTDGFMPAIDARDQSGIRYYSPAAGGIVRGNRVTGFHQGIFLKGVKGSFHVENNTVVGPGPAPGNVNALDIHRVGGWQDGDVQRGNSVTGFEQELMPPAGSPPEAPQAPELRESPALAGTVHHRAGKHGVAIRFETKAPCAASIQWGWDESCSFRIDAPRRVERRYQSDTGKEINLVDEPLRRTQHWAVIVPHAVAPTQHALFYRMELVDAAGRTTLTDPQKAALGGEARVWRVTPDGEDDADVGPLRTIQAAADRALPGDRIVLADGLYPDRVVIRNGGLPGAPLVIEAEHEHQALIDTNQDPDIHAVFQIDGARDVTIRGLEFRWFHTYAVYAWQTQRLNLERCKFWNMHFMSRGFRPGTGVFATGGSDLRVDHGLFFNLRAAFDILHMRGFTVTHNTVTRMTLRAALFIDSGPGLLRNNSFTFTGNYHYHLALSDEQFRQFDSDYNNLAQYVDMSYAAKENPTAEEKAAMLDPSGQDGSVYLLGNKGLVNIHGQGNVPFFSRWQRQYGKDLHSVFAHPRYVNPRRHDFRVPPDSPNANAGEGGQTLGAFDIAPHPSTPVGQELVP